MALLLILPPSRAPAVARWLKHWEPNLDCRVWPDIGDPEKITFAVTWNHPPGSFQGLAGLKAVSSFGAGVDHLLSDPQLPAVPLVRIVDENLSAEIAEFVIAVILNHKRNLLRHFQDQKNHYWSPLPKKPMNSVGILGLGALGKPTAERLKALGFSVSGWTRTKRLVPGVSCYSGSGGLFQMAPKIHFLVCMLPLTSLTRGIINKNLLDALPEGAYIINVGRGQHLTEKDLMNALNSGRLGGACLDVFGKEPLPPDHPFWDHTKILITPHIASLTDPCRAARQILENYHRLRQNRPLLHQVDRQNGY